MTIPELKDGLQFTHRGEDHCILYTLGKKEEDSDYWDITYEKDGKLEHNDTFTTSTIEYAFESGTWLPKP